MQHRFLFLLLPLLALTSCKVGPNYETRTPDVEEAWLGATAGGIEVKREWWKTFNDGEMTRQIERALQANHSLAIAAENLEQSRAATRITRARLLPTLGASTSGAATRDSEGGRFNFPGVSGGSQPDQQGSFYDFGFDAGWEIDLFGGNRRALESSRRREEAAAFQLADAHLTIAAETARAYIEVRGAQEQLAALRRNITAQADSLQFAQDRLDNGLGTALDVAQAEAQYESTRAQEPGIEATERLAIYQLGILTSTPASAIVKRLDASKPIPTTSQTLPAETPASILQLRPDVRIAERQLAAATSDVGVATAELYPKINLSTLFGWESQTLDSFFNNANIASSVGGSISAPLFRGGEIRQNIRASKSRAAQALSEFDLTVLEAAYGVEGALTELKHARRERSRQQSAVNAARKAAELAGELQGEGLVDIQPVLDANDRLATAETALARSKANVSIQIIALDKELGGGVLEETD